MRTSSHAPQPCTALPSVQQSGDHLIVVPQRGTRNHAYNWPCALHTPAPLHAKPPPPCWLAAALVLSCPKKGQGQLTAARSSLLAPAASSALTTTTAPWALAHIRGVWSAWGWGMGHEFMGVYYMREKVCGTGGEGEGGKEWCERVGGQRGNAPLIRRFARLGCRPLRHVHATPRGGGGAQRIGPQLPVPPATPPPPQIPAFPPRAQ